MLILPSWLDAESTFISCSLLVYKLHSFSALSLLSSLTREGGSEECCPVSVLILRTLVLVYGWIKDLSARRGSDIPVLTQDFIPAKNHLRPVGRNLLLPQVGKLEAVQ